MTTRFDAKQLSLTYPQCPLERSEVAKQLHVALDNKQIIELVIAQEHHTTEGLHIHAYVKLKTRYSCKGEHMSLHLRDPADTAKIYKPNVQSTKNKLAWVKYLHKEDKNTHTEGIDAKQYIDASESKTRILGKRLIQGEALEQLVQEPGFEQMVVHYKQVKNSIEAYRLDTQKPFESNGMRGAWYYGPPGSGKSYAARSQAVATYDEEPYIMTGNKWLDGYKG